MFKNEIITKILPVGAELFHADWRTDRHNEANSHFSQICLKMRKLEETREKGNFKKLK
jgi:hypothetical protein